MLNVINRIDEFFWPFSCASVIGIGRIVALIELGTKFPN